jgi:hypothetical protein
MQKIIFAFETKPATLIRRSMVLSLPLQLVFPGTAKDLALAQGSLTERDSSVW